MLVSKAPGCNWTGQGHLHPCNAASLLPCKACILIITGALCAQIMPAQVIHDSKTEPHREKSAGNMLQVHLREGANELAAKADDLHELQ